jgi:hypothetical protein
VVRDGTPEQWTEVNAAVENSLDKTSHDVRNQLSVAGNPPTCPGGRNDLETDNTGGSGHSGYRRNA